MTKQKFYTKSCREVYSIRPNNMWGVVYNDDLPYVAEQEFSTYDEAVAAAKKTARKTKEDVEIYSIHSVVKFPETDLEVETMVQTT